MRLSNLVVTAGVTLIALGACSTNVVPRSTLFTSSPASAPAATRPSGPTPTPSSAPTATAPISAATHDFTAYLSGYGQVFTPADPPPDAADWHAAVADVPAAATGASAIYGTVSCVDPAKNCAERGLARPGERLDIWFVTFEDVHGVEACWWTVDAHSGAGINGSKGECW